MPRRDTNDNRYNRQTPNNTEIIIVHVETIMGPKVESFLLEPKADIIAAKAKKPTRTRKAKQPDEEPEQAWTADWPVSKYAKTGYTRSGTSREEVVEDVRAVIKRKVISWHLREYVQLQAAQRSIRELRARL